MGSQSMVRQCLVAAIMHQPTAKSSASLRGAHSNQGFQPYLQMRCQERQSVRGWRKLL